MILEPSLNPTKDGKSSTRCRKEQRVPGMNVYICTTDNGDATLQWPKTLTHEDLEMLEVWLEMMKKKIQRSAGQKETIHGTIGPIDKEE